MGGITLISTEINKAHHNSVVNHLVSNRQLPARLRVIPCRENSVILVVDITV
jgi:hypothetical protein